MCNSMRRGSSKEGGRQMTSVTQIYRSPKGGSIICYKGYIGRVFLSCVRTRCIYSSDLHTAKDYLDSLEKNKRLPKSNVKSVPAQAKTSLKWSANGELSPVDMARILDRLSKPELTECELACKIEVSS